MLEITENERRYLRERIEDADTLINAGSLGDLLNALSDWMMDNGFDDNDEITDTGREAERVYDAVFYRNKTGFPGV